MAISGKFLADFSDFTRAVQQADTQLRGFESSSARVGTSLNRMTNSFAGTKVIQEATLMAEAVDRIGGAAKLTEAELKRVASTAADAAAKMRAMGIDVPDRIANLAQQAKGATSALGQMGSVASSLAGAFGVAFGVGTVVNFGRAIFEAADHLTKLEARTGLSVEALQRLQSAGDDAGNSVEELAGAVVSMQDRIAGGSTDANKALQALGLTMANLRGMTPENQFIAISDAIRQIEDPAQQVTIAMDLFGRTGAAVLPTLKRGFDDVRDSAAGMSAAAVKAIDDAGDALTRFGGRAKAVAGEALGAFFREFTDFLGLRSLVESMDAAGAAADRLLPKLPGIAPVELPANVKKLEDALDKEVEALIKVNTEVQKFTGATLVEASDVMLLALRELDAKGLRPMPSAFDGMVAAMKRAQEALITTGNVTDASWKKYDALEKKIRQLSGLDPTTGLLPSTNLGVGLTQAPTVGPNTTPQLEGLHQLTDFQRRYNDELAITDALVEEYHKAQTSALSDGMKMVDQLTSKFRALNLALAQGEWLSRKPDGMSVTQYLNTPGPALQSLRGNSVTVNVNAQGSFYDNPESVNRLARTVGDAVLSRVGTGGGLRR
jgi:hypothetical protein